MPSNAHDKFGENKKDIGKLWTIHEEWSGVGPGAGRRPAEVEVLNRAAIVFITACWEAYVEDVAMEAFDFLLANAPSASQVPAKVQALAAKSLLDDPNVLRVWDLADTGWKAVLQMHRDAAKEKWVSSLNTPKRAQVDELFESLLGLRSVSAAWLWQKMSSVDAAAKLDAHITIRGNIAHRVTHDATVYKHWGTGYLNHVERLVEKTDAAVAAHLKDALGAAPW